MNDDFKAQLTTLALEELPADEREKLEAAFAETREAESYLRETREFCQLLTQTLAAPGETALSDEQREELAKQLAQSKPEAEVIAFPQSKRRVWLGLGAAAATLAVLGSISFPKFANVSSGSARKALEAAMRENAVAEYSGGKAAPSAPVDESDFKYNQAQELAQNVPYAEARQKLDQLVAKNEAAPAQVKEGLERAEGYANLGDYAKAKESYDDVLKIDRYNTAARRGLEGMDRRRSSESLLAANDNTRAQMLREVDKQWETAAGTPAAAAASRMMELSEPKPVTDFGSIVAESTPSPAGPALLTAVPAAPAAPETSAVPADATPLARQPSDPFAPGNIVPSAGALRALPYSDAPAAGAPTGTASRANVADSTRSRMGSAELDALREKNVPADIRGDFDLGVGYAELGNYDKARESFGRALAQSGGNEVVRLGLDIVNHEVSRRLKESEAKQPNTEAYAEVPENPFVAVGSEPLSTFSIDVDTASYANVRRFLNQGQRPPRASVRLEELVNYFKYTYPQPEAGKPFSVTVEMTECPWQPQHRLARIGLQGRDVAREERPAANLVFLIDVSGSMDEPNKLPLVKQSLHLLTGQLKGSDHVALVTYASGTGVALPSTSLEQKDTVRRAIDSLTAGGSTNGASGLQLAYQQARQHFKKYGVNRVILATDGDFNVGITSQSDLQNLITSEAQSGVFLSVLGYGMGNLKDATMELLADKGNGNYAYIDSLGEARKVLADQAQGTLVTIAKDVKIQIEFNPAVVRNYRLLGYENRLLAKEDFNDDKKDAGEIGAGHTVTALYEIVPMSAPAIQPPVDALRYQQPRVTKTTATAEESDSDKSAAATPSNETMTVKLRYKQPDGDVSQLIEVPVVDNADATFAEAPGDFKFAASVAMYGLLLKDSAHKGSANWNMVRDFARAGKGNDAEGYRGEFLQLVEKAAGVAP